MLAVGIVLVILTAASSAQSCGGKILPGLSKLKRGVDITLLDLLPLEEYPSKAFKHELFEYHCAKGKNWVNPYNKESYQIPDEVSVMPISSGNLPHSAHVYQSYGEFQATTASELGMDPYMDGTFSGSASVDLLKENSTLLFGDIYMARSAFRADLPPHWKLDLSANVNAFVSALLAVRYEDNPKSYDEFISYFGTHYFTHANLGGVFRAITTMPSGPQNSLLRDMSIAEIEHNTRRSFYKSLQEQGGISSRSYVQTPSYRFTQKTSDDIRTYGGVPTYSLGSESLWDGWVKSIPDNPWLIGGQVSPISQLIDNADKKASMERAVKVHREKAYILYEALFHYKRLLHKTSNPALKKRIEAAVAKYSKYAEGNATNSLLDEVKKDVIVPDWFHKSELCMKWDEVDTNNTVNECGTSASGKTCALVDTMTNPYADTTHRGEGGCQLAWGIQASDHDTWFNDVKICFEYEEIESQSVNVSQCGGTEKGSTCAPVNQFTDWHVDNTYTSYGGCKMSWSLTIPANAPVWMHFVTFCFSWAQKNPYYYYQYDCSGKYKNFCVLPNVWTPFYTDKSHRSNGGCYMTWGMYYRA